jgi:hypothetical protein
MLLDYKKVNKLKVMLGAEVFIILRCEKNYFCVICQLISNYFNNIE